MALKKRGKKEMKREMSCGMTTRPAEGKKPSVLVVLTIVGSGCQRGG